jgi:hypothetical protein
MREPEDENDLAAAAVRAFEEARDDPPMGLSLCFRLWHHPGEGPWVTWVLFVPQGREDGDGAVREVGWNRPAAGPDLWIREAVVPAADLRRLLSRASNTTLIRDHLDSSSMFPDWTEFGIEGSSMSQRVQWDAPVPYPFRTLAVWYSRARGMLLDCLDRAQPR